MNDLSFRTSLRAELAGPTRSSLRDAKARMQSRGALRELLWGHGAHLGAVSPAVPAPVHPMEASLLSGVRQERSRKLGVEHGISGSRSRSFPIPRPPR